FVSFFFFFFQAEDGIRDFHVTGVQTCALPIWWRPAMRRPPPSGWPPCSAATRVSSSADRRRTVPGEGPGRGDRPPPDHPAGHGRLVHRERPRPPRAAPVSGPSGRTPCRASTRFSSAVAAAAGKYRPEPSEAPPLCTSLL